MDVTSQNISNADVEGYSRKRLNVTADYRRDSKFGQAGFGVNVVNIERMRNVYIDQQIQRQNQFVGLYGELDYTLERIENIFTEPGDTGLQHYLDKFFDAWQNVVNNPSDLPARTMVKTQAQVLCDTFHNLSGELGDLRQSINTDLGARVDRVNELALKIYNMNQEIAEVEISDQNANDSRDNRDQLVKELSKLVDVSVVENERGQISVSTAGSLLVSPVFYQELETTTTSFQLPDGTSRTDIGIRWAASKRTYMPLGGQLKGLFQARDTVVPEYQENLDTLANALVREVNTTHEQGFNLLGYSGIKFFEPDSTGASDINVAQPILSNVQNIAAAQGSAERSASVTTNPGDLDFGNQPGVLTKTLGRLLTPADPSTERARDVISGSVVVTAGGTTLTEGTDYQVNYAQGEIQMLHNGYDGQAVTIDFNYRTGGFAGPGNNANALAIAQLRQAFTMDPDAVGNPRATFSEYYTSFIGKLGLSRNEAASNLESREFLVEEYQTHQDAIAGVSLDEEMANLIKYQHTYQAAARLISTTDEMLDILLNI
jgi:flagellar hook-associated protein 1 FlgK